MGEAEKSATEPPPSECSSRRGKKNKLEHRAKCTLQAEGTGKEGARGKFKQIIL